MKIVWHDEAAAELDDAALYYGAIDDELGERFAMAAEIAVAELKASPRQPRKFDGEARKVRLKRFPYAVIYWIDKDRLHIVGVMHLHREPGYWRHRL
jgi:plasmid stabilization system protein ParE